MATVVVVKATMVEMVWDSSYFRDWIWKNMVLDFGYQDEKIEL